MKEAYEVRPVETAVTLPFIMKIHYAKRRPSISYAFGLFLNSALVGIVTYGTPAGSTQRTGLAGKENAHLVLELNRLCLLNNLKNEASILVSRSLKLLPKGRIIISYADISQGHDGCVYRAANFYYCGLTAKRRDLKIKGEEHLHSQTAFDRVKGQPNPTKILKERYGAYYVDRPRKHRYVYITGGKSDRKRIRPLIKYKIEKFDRDSHIKSIELFKSR